jgi:hypothetical protein
LCSSSVKDKKRADFHLPIISNSKSQLFDILFLLLRLFFAEQVLPEGGGAFYPKIAAVHFLTGCSQGCKSKKGSNHQPPTSDGGDPIQPSGSAEFARPRRPGTGEHQEHANDDVVPDEGLYIAKSNHEGQNDIPKLPESAERDDPV